MPQDNPPSYDQVWESAPGPRDISGPSAAAAAAGPEGRDPELPTYTEATLAPEVRQQRQRPRRVVEEQPMRVEVMNLLGTDLPTLYLEAGRFIYVEGCPERPLYNLSRAILRDGQYRFEIARYTHTLRQNNIESSVSTRKQGLYDIALQHTDLGTTLVGSQVEIVGGGVTPDQLNCTRLVFRRDFVMPVVLLTRCAVEVVQNGSVDRTLFSAGQAMGNLVAGGRQLEWRKGKGGGGTLAAVELMPRWARAADDGGSEQERGPGWSEPPRLEIKTRLSQRELDFLVTCWMARVRRLEMFQEHQESSARNRAQRMNR